MDDKYEFLSLIGKGSTGGVYEAKCKTSGDRVTIRRFFSDDGVRREGWEHDFLKVVQQLSKVRHPNVSPILKAALDEDGAYVVTEFHPTSQLNKLCKGGVSLEIFKKFALHGLAALEALHDAEIVHGRIGLDSFVVAHNNVGIEKFVLKDYGLRRIAPLIQGLEPSSQLPSNPVFLSPEHFDSGYLDDRTDLYMFGQLCFIMLAGCHPIAGHDIDIAANMHFENNYGTVQQYRHEIPTALSQWVEQMTAPQAEHRPASSQQAITLFHQACDKSQFTPPINPIFNTRTRLN